MKITGRKVGFNTERERKIKKYNTVQIFRSSDCYLFSNYCGLGNGSISVKKWTFVHGAMGQVDRPSFNVAQWVPS